MKFEEKIRQLLSFINQSKKFHCLCIEGPPGWGKSTAAYNILKELELRFVSAGSYITPVGLFKLLLENPDKFIVLDDTEGLFNSRQAMTMINSAICENGQEHRIIRRVTSDIQDPVIFKGKIIVLTNHIPKTSHISAFLSRALVHKINFSSEEFLERIDELEEFFGHKYGKCEYEDVKHIFRQLLLKENGIPRTRVTNLRNFELALELRITNPTHWKNMLLNILEQCNPNSKNDNYFEKDLINKLGNSDLPISDQIAEYKRITGNSRRSYYYARQTKRNYSM